MTDIPRMVGEGGSEGPLLSEPCLHAGDDHAPSSATADPSDHRRQLINALLDCSFDEHDALWAQLVEFDKDRP